MGEFDVPVPQGINMKIEAREFVAIIGPSGCGKSTMLNMIGCLDMPTRGKVLLEDRDISEFKSNELARVRGKKIGFIFQTFNLYPTLTALENIQLPMRIHEISEKEVDDTSKKLLAQVGLSERGSHFPAQLSGGQQQRVAVARSLSTAPSILLADESTGNLDTKSGGEVMDVFKRLNNEGLQQNSGIHVNPDAVEGDYYFNVYITYKGQQISAIAPMSINKETLQFKNTGTGTVQNAVAEINLAGANSVFSILGGGTQFSLGNLKAGDEASITFDLAVDIAARPGVYRRQEHREEEEQEIRIIQGR